MSICTPKIISVALNPAIDRGIEVPDFRIGSHAMGRQIFRRPAGKAVNVARILKTLEIPAMLTGFVGRNQQDYFESSFREKNNCVSCQLFAVDGQTRENITIVDPIQKVETHIRDRGFAVGAPDLDKLQKKLSLLCSTDTIVSFSGSLPPGMSNDDFLSLIKMCQAKKSRVCIDSGGEILRLCKELTHKPWLIKPNRDELSEMLDEKVEDVGLVADKIKKYVSIGLISVGKEGAYLLSEHLNIYGKVKIDQETVQNTVGCGDALLAGFLAGIAKNKDMEASLSYALAVAGAAAISITPADISIDMVEELFEKVEMENGP